MRAWVPNFSRLAVWAIALIGRARPIIDEHSRRVGRRVSKRRRPEWLQHREEAANDDAKPVFTRLSISFGRRGTIARSGQPLCRLKNHLLQWIGVSFKESPFRISISVTIMKREGHVILWLTSLPLWQCAVLVIGLTTVGTMLLTVLIRRIVGFERLVSNNEVAGFKFAVLGVVYAVLLGFAVITVWEKFKQAQEAVTSEASASATIYRLTGGTEGASQAAVRAAVRQYLKKVVTYEANTMEIGDADVSTTLALNSLYNAVLALRPQGPEDLDLFVATLGELHTLAEARRERLELSRGAVPPVMWAVLFGGAVLTIAFAFFFGTKHVRSQVIMAGMLAAVIFMSVFVIININYPFTGELRVSLEPLKYTLDNLDTQD